MAKARHYGGIAYRCPECGNNVLRIEVPQTATVRFDGDDHEVIDVEGDVEWDADSDATCAGCNYTGTLRHFDPENN